MIKFIWAIVITIVSLTLLHQSAFAQFSDDFSDGDFVANPPWSGNDSKFAAGSNNLQLIAPAEAGTAFLQTPSEAISNASWEFTIHLGFNPSSGNYARVYLVADQADLTNPLNGYFVLIGGTPDEISLYQQSGTTQTKIIDGVDGSINLSVVDARIKVTRDDSGNWELYSDVGLTGDYFLEGVVNNTTHTSAAYFGVYCVYTATRSDQFSFDDFIVTGEPYVDNTIQPEYKDIIVTEIFADPTPRVELPEAEFIEIFNRSSSEFNLNNWSLSDGSSTAQLSDKILLPGEYLVIVPTSSLDQFSSLENVIGVSSFPSLNNTGDNVILKSGTGLTIDSVQYSDTWYRDSEKKEGGWSIELIDPNNICAEEKNWIASEDEKGGTPSKQNSVFANKPDVTGPSLINVFAFSSNQIRLEFDEKLADEEINIDQIFMDPAQTILGASFSDNALRSLDVTLSSEIQTGLLYKITVNNIRDCSLNMIHEEYKSLAFALPEEADSLDIVINEILFNPLPTGVDFVELYNNSTKYINLKDWKLGNFENESFQNGKILSDKDLLFSPYSYKVVTSSPDIVVGQYSNATVENFHTVDIPSLPDDEGSIAVTSSAGKIIDAVIYKDDFHSPLIKDEEGVSLERVSFFAASNDPQNWKSASTRVDYATPGYMNSNTRVDNVNVSNSIQIDPEIFQPVYGQPNFTQIHYRFSQGGYIANAKIYDAQSRLIKVLANNEVLGTEGFYRWDGDRDDGSKARIGYYFVWFEIFNLAGEVQTFRKRVIIAGQF